MYDKYYKPSNRFSWAGLVVLVLVILLVGSGLSWLYLLLNRKCTVAILNVLAAFALGAVVGLAGGFVVKNSSSEALRRYWRRC